MSWRRIILLTAGLLVLLLAATWIVLQKTGAARTLVQAALQRLLTVDFALRDAVIDLAGGTLTLQDLHIADPVRPGSPLVRVERVQLGIDPNPLGSPLSVHAVEISGLDLQVDLTAGRLPALAEILRLPASGSPSTPALPPIRLRDSAVTVTFAAGLPPLRLSGIDVALLPERGAPHRAQLQGSARCAELAFDFQLAGSGDLRREEFLANARLTGVRVDDDLLRRLDAYLPGALPQSGVAGTLDEIVLWFEHRSTAAEPELGHGSVAGFAARGSGVTCRLPELPYPVVDASLECAATTADGGTVRARFQQSGEGGSLDVRASCSELLQTARWQVRGSGRSIQVDQQSLAALAQIEVGRLVAAAIAPRAGTVDAELFVSGTGGEAGSVDVDITVSGAALAYHGFGADPVGFPLPLVNGRGRVRVRGRQVTLEGLTAEIDPAAGGGTVHCDGFVETLHSGDDVIRVDVRAPQLQFGPGLRSALAALMRDGGALYDQFQPDGAAAVAVRVRLPDADPWQVRIEPLAAGAAWQGFPLRLAGLRGEILVREAGVAMDLQAVRGGSAVQLRGRLQFPPDGAADWRTELWLRGDDLAVDPELRDASLVLAPELQALWDALGTAGTCTADLTLWRGAGDPALGYDARIAIRQGTFTHPAMTMPLQDVAGDVFVHGTGRDLRIDLDAVRGALPDPAGNRPARVALVGSLHRRDGGSFAEDVTAVVRDLQLDDRLADSLDRLGALRRATWNVMAPAGAVDLVFHRRRAPGDPEVHQRLAVELRDVRSNAAMLPQPAREVSGALEIVDGRVSIRDVQARLGSAMVSCREGHVAAVRDDPGFTEVSFKVSAERFPVDDGLANLFEGPMAQAILERQLRGAVRVPELHLTFLVPPDDQDVPFTTIVEGALEAMDVSLQLGTRVEAVHGLVRITPSRIQGEHGFLEGSIERGSFRLFDQPCQEVAAAFRASSQRVEFPRLEVRLHGGRIEGRADGTPLAYAMPARRGADGTLSLDLDFAGINLAELLRQGGMSPPPYSGALGGQLRLERLRGDDFVDMAASGNLRLNDGNLGTVPVFTAIYALLSESNRPRFESAALRFRVADRNVELEDLVLSSPLIQVSGRGTMSMEGYVDVRLTLDNLFGGSGNLLVLPSLVQTIAAQLLRFHLFGHLRDLRAENRWFTERDPRRRRLVPVPPRLDRPKRPDY